MWSKLTDRIRTIAGGFGQTAMPPSRQWGLWLFSAVQFYCEDAFHGRVSALVRLQHGRSASVVVKESFCWHSHKVAEQSNSCAQKLLWAGFFSHVNQHVPTSTKQHSDSATFATACWNWIFWEQKKKIEFWNGLHFGSNNSCEIVSIIGWPEIHVLSNELL